MSGGAGPLRCDHRIHGPVWDTHAAKQMGSTKLDDNSCCRFAEILEEGIRNKSGTNQESRRDLLPHRLVELKARIERLLNNLRARARLKDTRI